MGITFPLKLVTVAIDLGISSNECDMKSKESIAEYLNKMLYNDPEFFGGFGPENIISVTELE
jgi:hypothetical protein